MSSRFYQLPRLNDLLFPAASTWIECSWFTLCKCLFLSMFSLLFLLLLFRGVEKKKSFSTVFSPFHFLYCKCMLTRWRMLLLSVTQLCFCSLCHTVFLSWGSNWFQMCEGANNNPIALQVFRLRFILLQFIALFFFVVVVVVAPRSWFLNCTVSFSNI